MWGANFRGKAKLEATATHTHLALASLSTFLQAQPTKETIFLYGHRRRMSISEDLLNIVYEHFEDIIPPLPAHEIDPKNFR